MSDTNGVRERLKTSEKVHVEHEEKQAEKHADIKYVKGSEPLALAIAEDPPKPWSKYMIQHYAICSVAFLCASLNGYDGSLMGNMLVMVPFEKEFGASIVGAKAGYITSMYTIGSVCALPFIGPVSDKWGRRVGIFTGCAFVILGTIIEATTTFTGLLGQFLAGRFFLGFGAAIANAAAPTYIVELAHPKYRGRLTGLYNTIYDIGSIVAAGTLRASVQYDSNLAWVIPTWIQMVFSGIVVVVIFFLPESPRWLFTNGRKEEAKQLLTKYHGEGNADNVFVKLQMQEFHQVLELDGTDKRWWDFRGLFNSRESRYRTLCLSIMSVFDQWVGNAVTSYFMPAFLKTAGVTNPVTVLNINLGTSFAHLIFSVSGALVVDRFGRRNMFMGAICWIEITWIITTLCTGLFNEGKAGTGAADAAILFVNLFSVGYSMGITPLQALYCVEVLSYENRAKGMAFSAFLNNVALLVNQFGMPVALGNIGWKTYLVFVGWDLVEIVVVYFFFCETKGRTLEEMNAIFSAKNPRKESVAIRAVDLNKRLSDNELMEADEGKDMSA